jgi:uncharacterized protein (TIGR03435 family)
MREGRARSTLASMQTNTLARFCLSGILGATVVALHAQNATFEVASVKRSTAPPLAARLDASPSGLVTVVGIPLRELVRFAYSAVDVIGGPSWIASDRFDIVAKAPAGVTLDRSMLQALLRERFNLQVHSEKRELAVYDLVLARNDKTLGPRLSTSTCAANAGPAGQPSSPGACGLFRIGGGASVTVEGMTMPELAARLAQFPVVQRPVRDRTGLSGAFDFQLDFVGANNPNPNAGPGLFTALQEQLGLKLDAQRDLVEVIVIDRAEPPTEN